MATEDAGMITDLAAEEIFGYVLSVVPSSSRVRTGETAQCRGAVGVAHHLDLLLLEDTALLCLSARHRHHLPPLLHIRRDLFCISLRCIPARLCTSWLTSRDGSGHTRAGTASGMELDGTETMLERGATGGGGMSAASDAAGAVPPPATEFAGSSFELPVLRCPLTTRSATVLSTNTAITPKNHFLTGSSVCPVRLLTSDCG